MIKVPQEVIDTLNKAQSVLIVVHQKPDGDAIGSAIGMGKGLKSLGKDVDYFIDNNIEEKIKFFDEIENFNKNLKDHYDALVVLDTSTFDFTKHPENMPDYDNLVLIDHHKSNEKYGDVNFVEITGATAELVYLVLKALNAEFDDEMYQAIYTGISTDTGSFQYANVTDQTHQIASELTKDGRNYSQTARKLHHQRSFNSAKLYAKAIDSMKLFHNGKIAISALPYETIEEYGGSSCVSDDTATIGMNIDSVILSCLLKETEPGELRLSLRSKAPYDLDVSKVALEYDGGGHNRAAGGTFEGSIEEATEELVKKFDRMLEDINE